jgi:single-strand DNA-binding protein
MPNKFFFDGRLAANPELKTSENNTARTRFRLIRNEYAGRDGDGAAREREVSIPFVAFGKNAENIAAHCLVGDQLVIEASISNNDYTDKDGIDRYEFNFVVEHFDFGAPGAAKRKKLAEAG